MNNESKVQTSGGWQAKWRSLDDLEKTFLVKIQAVTMFKMYRKMCKSNSAYVDKGLVPRKGIRGGRATSEAARNQKDTDNYLKALEDLRFMINHL